MIKFLCILAICVFAVISAGCAQVGVQGAYRTNHTAVNFGSSTGSGGAVQQTAHQRPIIIQQGGYYSCPQGTIPEGNRCRILTPGVRIIQQAQPAPIIIVPERRYPRAPTFGGSPCSGPSHPSGGRMINNQWVCND